MQRTVSVRAVPLALLLAALPAAAQTPAASGYLTPPAPIAQILDAQPTPGVLVGRDGRTLALLARENLPPISELAEPELRLAGIRMSPRTNGPAPSRVAYLSGITFQDLESGTRRPVQLPAGARVTFTRWSPDGSQLAFANATATGLELWVADVATAQARRLTGPVLNAAFGTPYDWAPDGRSLLFLRVLPNRGQAPAAPTVPSGPVIQENAGRAAPARTFQDLLRNAHDEALFEHYFTSQPTRIALSGGAETPLGEPGLVTSFSPSPDGRYLLTQRVRRPFSYLVPVNRFPTEIRVHSARDGAVVYKVADLPLAENLSPAFDAVPTGPRSVQWRADAPATLAWVEAQDGGDPRREAKVRDRVLLLDAPFTGTPRTLIDLEHRYGGITWGRDDFALVTSGWWNTRWERRFAVAPGRPGTAPRLLVDRTYDDRYGDPGDAVTTTNAAGRSVLMFTPDGRSIWLEGEGASQKGNYPFLDRMDVASGRTTRVWRAEDPYYEFVAALLKPDGSRVLTRRETQTDAPNYFVRTFPGGQAVAVTQFGDPAPQLAGIQRQLITYPRADGVMLSGTLYLPPNYDAKRDGPLPLLMWAYPQEFRDAAAAAQVTDSPNRFSRPGGISHLFVLTQGYAVLDNPTMPIIGEGEKEPNDTYVEQLVAGAQAAVDKVVEMGVASRDRIAVGGHSYGAFMTANLLAHSDLFRAGIARSGAYNRTLTPFGFQAEQRTYWEATETYTRMSPFTYANKVNEPILLIHGEIDDNSGTFPVQTERFYAALKGHGATARYVVLPYETHGYRARESVGHTLAEMVAWLDRYVKNAPPRQPAQAAAAPATR
jgi:dipeptidyl aminopeptidase/acylaminoacyl peptidase